MLEVNFARRAPAVVVDERAAAGLVSIALQESIGRVVLRAKPSAVGEARTIGGFPVDGPVNSRREKDGCAALRLGPDEWMLLCEDGETDAVVEAVAGSMSGSAYSLVDVSHRDVSFDVTGVDAASVINAGTPIDLSLAAFPVGMATRTVFGKSDIVLARIAAHEWRVTCWRSFSEYVHGLLSDAARDYAGRN